MFNIFRFLLFFCFANAVYYESHARDADEIFTQENCPFDASSIDEVSDKFNTEFSFENLIDRAEEFDSLCIRVNMEKYNQKEFQVKGGKLVCSVGDETKYTIFGNSVEGMESKRMLFLEGITISDERTTRLPVLLAKSCYFGSRLY